MKYFGKFIAYQLLTFYIGMYFIGGHIVFVNGDTVNGLNIFQGISGLIFVITSAIGGFILLCGLILAIVFFLIWSFKNDDRTFVEYVKGLL